MIQVKSLKLFAYLQLFLNFSFVPENLLHPSASSFKSLWYLCSRKTLIASCRYHEICQRSSKFNLKSKPMLPEKQSRWLSAQISSVHSDDLGATLLPPKSLLQVIKHFRATGLHFMGAFWCHIGQLHNAAQLHERNNYSGTWKPNDWNKGKENGSFVYFLSLTG